MVKANACEFNWGHRRRRLFSIFNYWQFLLVNHRLLNSPLFSQEIFCSPGWIFLAFLGPVIIRCRGKNAVKLRYFVISPGTNRIAPTRKSVRIRFVKLIQKWLTGRSKSAQVDGYPILEKIKREISIAIRWGIDLLGGRARCLFCPNQIGFTLNQLGNQFWKN